MADELNEQQLSTFKGTPGPWQIKATALVFEIVNLKECCVVARTNGWDEKFLGEERSNAQLIAAAPELLETLIACDEAMAYMSEYDIPLTLPAQVKAAIAKALGKGE